MDMNTIGNQATPATNLIGGGGGGSTHPVPGNHQRRPRVRHDDLTGNGGPSHASFGSALFLALAAAAGLAGGAGSAEAQTACSSLNSTVSTTITNLPNNGIFIDGNDCLTIAPSGVMRQTIANSIAVEFLGNDNRLVIEAGGRIEATASNTLAIVNGRNTHVTANNTYIVRGSIVASGTASYAYLAFGDSSTNINNTFTLADGGEIMVTGDLGRGISEQTSGNTYHLNGTMTVTGSGARLIHTTSGDVTSTFNMAGTFNVNSPADAALPAAAVRTVGSGSTFNISGTINVANPGKHYAIYNFNGDNTYNINGATITGALFRQQGRPRLVFGNTANYSYLLRGYWRGAEGDANIRHTEEEGQYSVINTAVTAANGGFTMNGNDMLIVNEVMNAAAIATTGDGGHAVWNRDTDGNDGNNYLIAGTVTTSGDNAHALHHEDGSDNSYTLSGSATTTGATAHAIYNQAGGSNEYTVSGTASAAGTAAHAIYNQAGGGNEYTISGTLSASTAAGDNAYAIYNQAGDNTYTIENAAMITGAIRSDVRATLILGTGVTAGSLTLMGDQWRNAAGQRHAALNAAAMQDITIAAAVTDTNDGWILDGGDSLTVAANSGSIATAARGSHGLDSAGDGNTLMVLGSVATEGAAAHAIYHRSGTGSGYTVSGSASTTGANAHAIYNEDGGGNSYTLSGTVSAAGTGSYAIYNQRGANTYTIQPTAMITGAIRSDVRATLILGAGVTADSLMISGDNWRNAAGLRYVENAVAERTITIDAAVTDTNDGWVVDGGDSLTVAADTGSIATTARGSHGLDSAGDGNTLMVLGSVATEGAAAHAIYHRSGTGGEYTVSGSATTMGANAHAIYNEAGGGNSYTLSGTVSAAGTGAYAIYNQAGDNTYTVGANAMMTGILKTDVEATLLLHEDFNDSGISLDGEWVDGDGEAVVLNRAPRVTGVLPLPSPAPTEGLPWTYLAGDLTRVFTDDDGDDLTFTFVDLPDSGWLTTTVDRASGAIGVTGTPPAGSGTTMVTLAVTADDGRGRPAARAELTVTILAPPPPPGHPTVANPIGPQQAIAGQPGFALPLADVFADPDDDELTLTVTLTNGMARPEWLELDTESAAAPRLFATTVGAAGTYMIRVTASDGVNPSISTDFTLTVTMPAEEPAEPMAVDDSFAFTRGERLTGGVLGNDSDANLDPLVVTWFWLSGDAVNRVAAGSALTLPTLGELTLGSDGIFALALNDAAQGLGAGQSRTVMVSYLASDGTSMAMFTETASAVGQLTLTVRGSEAEANAMPTAVWPVLPSLIAYAGLPFRYAVPANAFRDSDLEALSYSVTAAEGGTVPDWLGLAAADGLFTGTPTAEDVTAEGEPLALVLRAEDAAGAAATAAFRLTVAEAPAAPGTLTVANGMASLQLPYVVISPGAPGDASPCLALTLTAPMANLSAWEFTAGESARGCDLPAGNANLPLLDAAPTLDVPLARFAPASGAMTCLTMQFRYADMFLLTAMGAVACPAP